MPKTTIELDFFRIIPGGLTGHFSAALTRELVVPGGGIFPRGTAETAIIEGGIATIELEVSQPYSVEYLGLFFPSSTPRSRVWAARFQVPASSVTIRLSNLVAFTPITPGTWDASRQGIVNALLEDPNFLAIVVSGSGGQPSSPELTGLSALNSTGFVRRTGTGTYTASVLQDADIPGSIARDSEVTAAIAGVDAAILAARSRSNHTGSQTVDTITGLQAALDSKEALGAASSSVAAHVAAADPHSQYVTDSGLLAGLATKADAVHGHSTATSGAPGFMSATDKTKLDGIAAGATANSSDAFLLSRSNHTGSQAIGTITGLQTSLDSKANSAHAHTSGQITDFVAAVDARITAAGAAYQPIDTDLTAIAGLSTTPFGRSLLTQADATTARTTIAAQEGSTELTAIAGLSTTGILRRTGANTYAAAALTAADIPALPASRIDSGVFDLARIPDLSGLYQPIGNYQPLDVDLTAIAALSTAAYGRSLLTLADAAAGRSALELGTAATANSTAFATAAQGALAGTALQPEAIGVSVQAFSGRLAAIVSGFTAAPALSLLRKNLAGTGIEYARNSGLVAGSAIVNTTAFTNSTTEEVLYSFLLPANSLSELGHWLELIPVFQATGAGSKTYRIRIGGVMVFQFSSAQTVVAPLRRVEYVNATTVQFVPLGQLASNGFAGGGAVQEDAVNWTVDNTITIAAQLTTATDTVRIRNFKAVLG